MENLKYLNKSLYNEFFEKGYIIIKNALDRSEVDSFINCFENLFTRAQSLNGESQVIDGSQFVFEEGGLNRIVWCGGVEKRLLDLGIDQRITGPVADLLGSDILNHIINQAHFKMPGEQIEFKWHQDSEHRRYGTHMWDDVNGLGSYVQTVLAIDEMSLENGPLKFIPHSNKHGHIDIPNNENWKELVSEHEIVHVTMEPGDLALFGPYTIHSSSVNNSDKPRRVLINGYAYPGANGRDYPGSGLGVEISI